MNLEQNGKGLNILETQIVQRTWDRRWEKIVKIMDYDNSYTCVNESGVKITLTPEKWICVGVFDYLIDLEGY